MNEDEKKKLLEKVNWKNGRSNWMNGKMAEMFNIGDEILKCWKEPWWRS